MQTVVYDGSWQGFLNAVFDVYYFKFESAEIIPAYRFSGNIFGTVHEVHNTPAHEQRITKGMKDKLTKEGWDSLYRAFLSEDVGIEVTLLHYIQYLFASTAFMEKDYSHLAVITVTQTAKKVWREKHRMEAFVRFQKTGDGLFYSMIEPDHNVLPLISKHFSSRYADQRWLIYDGKRKYGLYYNLEEVAEVELNFSESVGKGADVAAVYDADEQAYQQLWQQYFKSVNIEARKNTKLHIQHMPRRYWKYLPEKKIGL
ncbi:MAG TPA: TIGR03915 family putative DNA repair protein [Flavisolibacter sp.]|jgi:probable DNA metabolism protein|nr:TIGR03915 family putative DNA repair protein [Flavisolibacter sp.]